MTKKFEENCLKNLCKSAKSAGNELELYFYIFITAMLIFLKKDKEAAKKNLCNQRNQRAIN
jgi:hypothetical protein